MSFFDQWLAEKKTGLTGRGAWREIQDMDHGADLILCVNSREVLNLASNNYLGLAGDAAMKETTVQAVRVRNLQRGLSPGYRNL